jgi:hypothetical protein
MQAVAVQRRAHQALLQDAQHIEREAIQNGVDLKAADGLRHHPISPGSA